MLTTGAGHGTVIPLLISSAPFGAFSLVAGLLGTPLVWAAIGVLVASPGHAKRIRFAQVLALLHYASALAIVLTLVATSQDELVHLARVLRISPEFFAVWATVYLGGQVTLWWRIGGRNHRPPAV